MASVHDVYGSVFERGSAVLLARIVDADGAAIQINDVSSITYTISEVDRKTAAPVLAVAGHNQAALSPPAVLFDTLQTAPIWTVDTAGYNFRHEIDVSVDDAFPRAPAFYHVRYDLQPVNGQKVVFRFLLRAH